MTLNNILSKAAVLVCSATLIPLLSSCLSEVNPGESQQGNIGLNTRTVPSSIMDNAVVYTFDKDEKYVGPLLNPVKEDSQIISYLPAAKWQLGIIAADGVNITAQDGFRRPPLPGGNMHSPMWVLPVQTQNSKEFLKEPPEILYVPIKDVDIQANQTTHIDENDARLFRNVAQVQFQVIEHTGFDALPQKPDFSEHAFIDLLNVPSTLTWEGKYGRDTGTNAITVAKNASGLIPMRKNILFDKVGNEMVADIVKFLVPAGVNDDNHYLKFQISMPLANAPFYGKTETPQPISIPIQANHIVLVKVIFSGEPDTDLDIKVTVKPWLKVDQTYEFLP